MLRSLLNPVLESVRTEGIGHRFPSGAVGHLQPVASVVDDDLTSGLDETIDLSGSSYDGYLIRSKVVNDTGSSAPLNIRFNGVSSSSYDYFIGSGTSETTDATEGTFHRTPARAVLFGEALITSPQVDQATNNADKFPAWNTQVAAHKFGNGTADAGGRLKVAQTSIDSVRLWYSSISAAGAIWDVYGYSMTGTL